MKTDVELVNEVISGRRESFEELIRRHEKYWMSIAFRRTFDSQFARDCIQDSYIKAFKSIDDFYGTSATSFRAWVSAIIRNTIHNNSRRFWRECLGGAEEIQAVDPDPLVEQVLIEDSDRAILSKYIDKLPDRQRAAVRLRMLEEFSFKEVAAFMDCPYNTAKANYRHGLINLREIIYASIASAQS